MTRVKKFELKFIDHEHKKKLCVEIIIHSVGTIEWDENDNNDEQYIAWLTYHGKKEMNLKKQVINFVATKYLGGNAFGPDNNYKLVKVNTSKQSNMINMGNGVNGNGIRKMREIKCIDCKMMKFMKGTMPSDWRVIFNYPKQHFIHEYIVKGDEEIDFDTSQKAYLEIPPEATHVEQTNVKPFNAQANDFLPSPRSSKVSEGRGSNQVLQPGSNKVLHQGSNQVVDQTGGSHDKYIKYKKKYLDLKNERR